MSSTAALTKGPLSVVFEYYGAPQPKEVINFHIFFAGRGRRPCPSVRFLFEKVVQEFEILNGLGEAYGLQETTNRLIRDFARKKFCIVYQRHAAAPAAGTPAPREETLGSTVAGLLARLRARLGL